MVHFTEKVVRIVGKVQLPTGTANRQGGTLVSAVRGKVILQSQGKEFFTWHGKDFFT